jgi:hypothetical protein
VFFLTCSRLTHGHDIFSIKLSFLSCQSIQRFLEFIGILIMFVFCKIFFLAAVHKCSVLDDRARHVENVKQSYSTCVVAMWL